MNILKPVAYTPGYGESYAGLGYANAHAQLTLNAAGVSYAKSDAVEAEARRLQLRAAPPTKVGEAPGTIRPNNMFIAQGFLFVSDQISRHLIKYDLSPTPRELARFRPPEGELNGFSFYDHQLGLLWATTSAGRLLLMNCDFELAAEYAVPRQEGALVLDGEGRRCFVAGLNPPYAMVALDGRDKAEAPVIHPVSGRDCIFSSLRRGRTYLHCQAGKRLMRLEGASLVTVREFHELPGPLYQVLDREKDGGALVLSVLPGRETVVLRYDRDLRFLSSVVFEDFPSASRIALSDNGLLYLSSFYNETVSVFRTEGI